MFENTWFKKKISTNYNSQPSEKWDILNEEIKARIRIRGGNSELHDTTNHSLTTCVIIAYNWK
jgi:hypothetical protein